MSVFDLVRDLKSFRRCSKEVIPRKVMGKIIESGRQAPSPGNVQSLEFVIVEDESKKEMLKNSCGDKRIDMAPTVAVIIADIDRMARRVGESMARDASNSEAAAAAQNMRLVAREEGVGSVWVSGFDEDKVAEQLSVPSGKQPLGMVAFGYSESENEKPSKFGLNEIAYYDEYGNQVGSVFDSLEWKGVRENRKIYGKKASGLVTKIKAKLGI